MKHFNKILAISLGFLIISGFLILPMTGVLAVEPGGGGTEGSTEMPNPLGSSSLTDLIAKITTFLIDYIVFPLVGLMIILSGFKFVTAQGNEEKIKKARQNLIWTITGAAVVLGADLIIGILQEVFGVEAAKDQWEPLYQRLLGYLNQIIVIIFALATIYFVWGVAQFVRSAGDQKKLEEGKKHMIYGIIGLTVMGGAWGIVEIIKNSLIIEVIK